METHKKEILKKLKRVKRLRPFYETIQDEKKDFFFKNGPSIIFGNPASELKPFSEYIKIIPKIANSTPVLTSFHPQNINKSSHVSANLTKSNSAAHSPNQTFLKKKVSQIKSNNLLSPQAIFKTPNKTLQRKLTVNVFKESKLYNQQEVSFYGGFSKRELTKRKEAESLIEEIREPTDADGHKVVHLHSMYHHNQQAIIDKKLQKIESFMEELDKKNEIYSHKLKNKEPLSLSLFPNFRTRLDDVVSLIPGNAEKEVREINKRIYGRALDSIKYRVNEISFKLGLAREELKYRNAMKKEKQIRLVKIPKWFSASSTIESGLPKRFSDFDKKMERLQKRKEKESDFEKKADEVIKVNATNYKEICKTKRRTKHFRYLSQPNTLYFKY